MAESFRVTRAAKRKKNWRQTKQSADATLPARVPHPGTTRKRIAFQKREKIGELPGSVANCPKKSFPCSTETNPSLRTADFRRQDFEIFVWLFSKNNRTENRYTLCLGRRTYGK